MCVGWNKLPFLLWFRILNDCVNFAIATWPTMSLRCRDAPIFFAQYVQSSISQSRFVLWEHSPKDSLSVDKIFKRRFSIFKIMECGINSFRCPIDMCVSFDELQNKCEFFKDLKLALHTVLDAKTIKVFDEKVGILQIMDEPGFLRCSLVIVFF